MNAVPQSKVTPKSSRKNEKRPPEDRASVRMDDELLTTAEAAALTKMSMAWYERKRWENQGGPPYRKRGRSVRYLKSELLAWWGERLEGDFRA